MSTKYPFWRVPLPPPLSPFHPFFSKRMHGFFDKGPSSKRKGASQIMKFCNWHGAHIAAANLTIKGRFMVEVDTLCGKIHNYIMHKIFFFFVGSLVPFLYSSI